jgi:hypothetical protein
MSCQGFNPIDNWQNLLQKQKTCESQHCHDLYLKTTINAERKVSGICQVLAPAAGVDLSIAFLALEIRRWKPEHMGDSSRVSPMQERKGNGRAV